MIGPQGDPGEIVRRMNSELDAVLKSHGVSGRLAETAHRPGGHVGVLMGHNQRPKSNAADLFITRTEITLE